MLSSRTPNPPRLSVRGAKRGVALVATLAILVIVTLLLVAYVTMMRLDQSATASYSQGLKAEQLGLGALHVVVGELQKEMGKDAGANLTYPSVPVFTNVTSTNILPQLVGTNAAMTNLVKISTTAPLFTGTLTNSTLRASTATSTNLSRNQRFMSAARWSRTGLGSFPANAALPNWVIMTRDGPTDAAALTFGTSGNTLNNPAPGNNNFALGRFAFAIYDVGGLLNINVAGFPTDATASAAGKGSVAWADLSQIPGIHKPDDFVKWRNAQNATSGSNYLTYVDTKAAPDGFASVSPGDTTFLSRADLLRYAESNPDVLDSSALPYLTTFSRDANAPNWGPSLNGTGAAFQYKADADAGTSINRFLPNVRVTVPFIRPDGSAANIGDPLVNRRFPLSRLDLVRYGSTASAGSDIHKFFGLTRAGTSAPWVYDADGDGTPDAAIKSLKDVADAGREPNFFELLYSGILNGSLGVGNGGGVLPVGNLNCFDNNPYYQLIRIGANIIDQYDADNFPTTINFNTLDFYGIEDIPYPNKILWKFITSSTIQSPAATPNWRSPMKEEVFFEMWNPHQQKPSSANPGPTEFRIKVNPEAQYRIRTVLNNVVFNVPYTTDGQAGVGYSPLPFDTNTTTVKFNLASAASYREPTVIRQDSATPVGDTTILSFPTTGSKALGFPLPGTSPSILTGTWPANPTPLNPRTGVTDAYLINPGLGAPNGPGQVWYWVNNNFNMIFSYQFKNSSGTWQTYATSGGYEGLPSTGTRDVGTWVYVNTTPWSTTSLNNMQAYSRPDTVDGIPWLKSDPRTFRMGVTVGGTVASYTAVPTPTQGDNPLITPSGIFLTKAGARLDLASQNRTGITLTSGTYTPYSDLDAIMRPGDSYLINPTAANWENNATTSRPPMKTGATLTRPLVLNRPFRSVGELGYVFRDMPWKTLDLFSSNSADVGLLDLFCINENIALTTGKVNLNTKHPAALKAVLVGTTKQEAGATTLPALEADPIAKAIISYSVSNPLLNLQDLSARLATNTTDLPSQIKLEREAVMRALAGSTSTRTWNLLIDLVVQSGRYPPTAASLEDFVVEGTRRYWMHVAIDRYTGKVIEEYLEAVND